MHEQKASALHNREPVLHHLSVTLKHVKPAECILNVLKLITDLRQMRFEGGLNVASVYVNNALESVTRECTLSNHCPSERLMVLTKRGTAYFTSMTGYLFDYVIYITHP